MEQLCPNCQQPNRPEARFCAACGVPLNPAPASWPTLQPGQRLKNDTYRIVRRLNKGGMGALYLAKDLQTFGRPCVIKQMLDYYDPNEPDGAAKARARFEEEGRTLASLSHPGIPKIYAFFEEAGRYYIVMEYIEGENLAQYVSQVDAKGRPLPGRRLAREQVLRYATQVAQVLEYLASQPHPVVHQDVKPSNLILERSLDFVRLVDFGTASFDGQTSGGSADTAPESVYGTIGYAPPEQYHGRPEPKSDVYALGATIYHLLTDDDPRDHPFKFPQMASLPSDIQHMLERALRPEVAQRISASELREELEVLQNPARVVQAFAFPTGERIRTVSMLPALADEHWEAAREFLYEGDFERWLRDLNRHDAVQAAEAARLMHEDRDAGLEAFLQTLDSGLTRPQLAVSPTVIDLGKVAREHKISRNLQVGNAERGYLLANLIPQVPWLSVHPRQVRGYAHSMNDVAVTIYTRMLPLRRTSRGNIVIDAGQAGVIPVEVRAQVSVAHELWRLLKRCLRGALPGSWQGLHEGLRAGLDLTRSLAVAARRQPWSIPILWLGLASTASLLWWTHTGSGLWQDYGLLALAVPPAVAFTVALLLILASSLIGTLAGAVRGGFRALWPAPRPLLPGRLTVATGLFAILRWWWRHRTAMKRKP